MAFYTAGRSVHKTFSVTIAGTVTTTTAGSADPATNEVQTITLTDGHTATGGTFTLTYDGQTTSAIAYDANAATIDAALEALSNIGAGDVSVSGTLNTGITVTFTGALAATNVVALTADFGSTTGTFYDRVILNGCHAGILRVRNRATSGNPIYFRVYAESEPTKTVPAAGDNETYVVPFSDLTDLSWPGGTAYVYIACASAQAYSVESISGLN